MSETTNETPRAPRASYPSLSELIVLEVPLHFGRKDEEEDEYVTLNDAGEPESENGAALSDDAGEASEGALHEDAADGPDARPVQTDAAPPAAAEVQPDAPPVVVKIHFRRLRSRAKVRLAAAQQANELAEKKRLAALRKKLGGKDVAPELYQRPRLNHQGKQVYRRQKGLVDEKRRPALIPVMDPPIATPESVEDQFRVATLLCEMALLKVEHLDFGEVRSESLDASKPDELEQLVDMLEGAGLLKKAIDDIADKMNPTGRQVF